MRAVALQRVAGDEIGRRVPGLATHAARCALDEAARVKAVARQGRDQLCGALCLGVIHTVAPYLLPDLVAVLRPSAPGMPPTSRKT